MPLSRAQTFHLAKGFVGRSKNCIRLARRRVERALQYQYISRRLKKRDMRALNIQQINAGVRQYGQVYSRFMRGLAIDSIALNRKMLSSLSQTEPLSFRCLTLRHQELTDKLPVPTPTRTWAQAKEILRESFLSAFQTIEENPEETDRISVRLGPRDALFDEYPLT